MTSVKQWLTILVLVGISSGSGPACAQNRGGEPGKDDDRVVVTRVLDRGYREIVQYSKEIDRLFQPVPLLSSAEESALRQYSNNRQLEKARQLGIAPPVAADRLSALLQAGTLVRMEDSTRYWVIRELEHSQPIVIPDARALLTEMARRFQAELKKMGSPPFRLEVTSVLRTTESQADLRKTNPNAARERSTHEYGTTLDVAYSSFGAPADPDAALNVDEASWLEPFLRVMESAQLEAVAARRSRELQAILGRVLMQMQTEGMVMVTMERLQPVYHVTVARRF